MVVALTTRKFARFLKNTVYWVNPQPRPAAALVRLWKPTRTAISWLIITVLTCLPLCPTRKGVVVATESIIITPESFRFLQAELVFTAARPTSPFQPPYPATITTIDLWIIKHRTCCRLLGLMMINWSQGRFQSQKLVSSFTHDYSTWEHRSPHNTSLL